VGSPGGGKPSWSSVGLCLALIVLTSCATAPINTEPAQVSASASKAELIAEPGRITRTGDELRVTLTLSTETDQILLLTRATLVDKAKRAYEFSGDPVGIRADVGDSCVLGTVIPTGTPQPITIPFHAPGAEPPFTLTVELQTPDPLPPSGCRTFAISLEAGL
jgi:hypothetical protein